MPEEELPIYDNHTYSNIITLSCQSSNSHDVITTLSRESPSPQTQTKASHHNLQSALANSEQQDDKRTVHAPTSGNNDRERRAVTSSNFSTPSTTPPYLLVTIAMSIGVSQPQLEHISMDHRNLCPFILGYIHTAS